jgi:hypothetical protein
LRHPFLKGWEAAQRSIPKWVWQEAQLRPNCIEATERMRTHKGSLMFSLGWGSAPWNVGQAMEAKHLKSDPLFMHTPVLKTLGGCPCGWGGSPKVPLHT